MIPSNVMNECLKDNTFSSIGTEGWIQPAINNSILPFSFETIINGMYAVTKSEKIIVIPVEDRSWFFTHEWQKLEEEADKDIGKGNWKSFESMDDFIADLEI